MRFAILPALGINEKKPGISLFLRARIPGFLFGFFSGDRKKKVCLYLKYYCLHSGKSKIQNVTEMLKNCAKRLDFIMVEGYNITVKIGKNC